MGVARFTSPVDVFYQEIVPRLSVESAYPDVKFRARQGRHWRGGCRSMEARTPTSPSTHRRFRGLASRTADTADLSFLNGGEEPSGSRFFDLLQVLADRVNVRLETKEVTPEHRAVSRRFALLEAFTSLAGEALARPEGAHVVRYLAWRGLPNDPDRLARLGFGVQPSAGTLASLRD